VILFSENQNQFIAQALSPAQNVKVISVKNNFANVQVPEDQLALAIGGGGENVRLAGILTGLDIKVSKLEAA
jgi:N utilization substance protein A